MTAPQTDVTTLPPSGGERGQASPIRLAELADGAEMWRIARDSKKLDLNASYAYLLWCRDFGATSVVAEYDGAVVGFVTGYLRPDQPGTLMVWQVAVDESARGQGLAGRMLADLVDRVSPEWLETTITEDNAASIALFSSLARDRHAGVHREPLFDTQHFPDGHDAEVLFRIGPFGAR